MQATLAGHTCRIRVTVQPRIMLGFRQITTALRTCQSHYATTQMNHEIRESIIELEKFTDPDLPDWDSERLIPTDSKASH